MATKPNAVILSFLPVSITALVGVAGGQVVVHEFAVAWESTAELMVGPQKSWRHIGTMPRP